MKQFYLFLIALMTFGVGLGQTTDLFISEYGEGSSGNSKYIEIYNGTGGSVDLSNYQLQRVTNGGSWPEATLVLSGTLSNGNTYVVANNATDVPGADLYNSGFCSWNGDDAVALATSSGTLLDVIGDENTHSDPGVEWTVGTSGSTRDNRLIRKPTICSPNVDASVSMGTNDSNSEWTYVSYASGSALAGHTANCSPSGPTITLSTSTLSGFDYVEGSGPSAEQTFTAAGSDLTADITITAPTNFEVSTTSGSGFGSLVTLTPSGGTVSTTTIYVRLASGLGVNTYNGNLTASSTGATTQNISLSGEVTPAPPVNDECANATPLTVGSSCSFSTYTNENGTNSGAPAPDCASYGGSDVWFSVVVPASGNLEIDTNIGTITDGGMAIYSGTCGSLTLIECDDDDSINGLMPALSLTGLTPSSTLYILFWEYQGDFEGTFDICVYEPVPPPTITLSETTLSGLDYVEGSGPSAEQTFTAAGSDLTADITITAPTNFEVSTTSGSGFGSSVTLTPSGGTVSTTTIYVRLASGLGVNTYNGTLTASSTGAITQNISLSGEVTSSGGSSCALTLDFETTGGYSTSTTEFTDGSADYFTRTDGSDINAVFTGADGTYFAAQDIDGEGATLPVFLDINGISIAGLSNLQFSIDLAEDDDGTNEDWDAADYVHITYRIDGGSYQNLLWLESSGGTNTAPAIDTDFDGTGDGTVITDTFATFNESISGIGTTLDIRIELNLDAGDEDIAFDNIEVCGDTSGGGCTPTLTQASNITFTNISQTQMDINWTNGGGDGRVVIMNTTNTFTRPANGDNPTANTTYSGSGQQVIYNNTGGGPITIDGLSASTTYWFRVYEYCSPDRNYQGATATGNPNSQATLDPPVITLSTSSITGLDYIISNGPSSATTFTAEGSNLTGNLTITAPANFEISEDDVDYSVNPIVLTPSSGSVSPTTIYVRLTGSLGLGNYTGTLTATSTGATTQNISLEGDVTASQASDIIAVAASEAATISSLINDTAPLGATDGIQVWQITVRDGGVGLNDTDNLPTIVTALTLAQGTGNSVGDWAANIETIALFDGSTFVATGTVTTNQIQFIGLNISVADNTQKTMSLRLSLACPLTEPDGDDFVFSLSNANTTFGAAGSGKASFAAAASTNGQNVIAVVATELAFIQQPTNTGVSSVMLPAVTVSAVDACGNTDLDFTGNISITSTGTLTGSPVTEAAVAGVATFSNLIHTVVESGRTLEATAAGLTADTSTVFDVLNITVLEGGDLAIVAINTDINNGEDQVCFMAFKDIIAGTSIEFTDNGFERVTAGLWGDTEGTVRFTYSGSTITAGTTICIQGQGVTYDIINCGSNDNANWTVTNLNGATQFNLNGTDQIWILQNGTWINPGLPHDATYTGNFVWGWTAIGWESEPGYNSTSGSTIPEGFTCFNSDVNGVSGSTDKVKYTGRTDTANQSEWISRINNPGNWTGYADNAAYNAQGPDYAGSCVSFSITAGGFASGLWTGDTDSNWFNCGNWDNRKVPDATTNVTVNSTDTIVINEGDAEVNNITITSGGVLTIGAGTPADGSSLTVFGDLTINENGTLDMESTSTSYSSLIPLGSVNNTGTIAYQRHTNQFNTTPGSTIGQNDLVSAPLTGQTFGNFRAANGNIPSGTIGGVPAFLFGPYDNVNLQYINYTTANDGSTLESGRGYRTASSNNSTLTYTGGVETGDVAVVITRPQGDNRWNLIGNPYPSYLSLDEFLVENSLAFDGTAAGIYGYDGAANDGWRIWNNAYRDANPAAVITPGQGFFVASRLGEPSPTVNFNIGMRRTGSSDDFIAGRSAIISYYLKLEIAAGSNKYYTEIYFNPNVTRSLDNGYDARLWGDAAPPFALYTHLVSNNTGFPMAVQSLPLEDVSGVTIPLGVHTTNNAPLTFRIVESTLPENIQVLLDDTAAQNLTVINNGSYTAMQTAGLNGTGRFYLGISDQSLTLNEGVLNGIHLYTPLQSRQLVVAGYLDRLTTARLYDLQGRLVQEYALQTGVSEQALDVRYFNAGVYVVVLDNGVQRLQQKVILD